MSAPFKQGLDYFTHDTYLSEDPKIEYIEAAHGLTGYAVFIKILEKIYRNGYYLNWSERDSLIFSKKNNIDAKKCQNIISDCLKESLFDKEKYNKYSILTSHGIQARYLKSCERRKNITIFYEFFNVDINWVKANIKKVNVTIKKLNGDIYSVIAAESKVKKSKGKNNNKDTTAEDDQKISSSANVKIDFDWAVNEFINITETDKKAWVEAYPAINLSSEIARAKEWLKSNPKNKKSNYRRFLTGWLGKAQDKTSRNGGEKNYKPNYANMK